MGIWDKGEWNSIVAIIGQWSGYILASAMAGVGLSTSFRSMRKLGIKPFYVGLFSAVMVGVTASALVFLLGRFITL